MDLHPLYHWSVGAVRLSMSVAVAIRAICSRDGNSISSRNKVCRVHSASSGCWCGTVGELCHGDIDIGITVGASGGTLLDPSPTASSCAPAGSSFSIVAPLVSKWFIFDKECIRCGDIRGVIVGSGETSV